MTMTAKSDTGKGAGRPDRKVRQAEQLRANLQRRKAQAKSRRAGAADDRPDGLATAKTQDPPET